jgi:hypothetical protein
MELGKFKYLDWSLGYELTIEIQFTTIVRVLLWNLSFLLSPLEVGLEYPRSLSFHTH